MTYQEIIDLINGNLADLSDIHPDEHREALIAVLDFARDGFQNIDDQINPIEIIADCFFSIMNLGDTAPTGGGNNFGSVELLANADNANIDVMYQLNFENDLTGNYIIIPSIESTSSGTSGWNSDNDVIMMLRDPNESGVKVLLREVSGNYQNLRIKISAIKY